MTGITFRHVAKRFGEVRVLEDLDLHIQPHELMVLVGPSGCGKTTALRMIAGLEQPSSGELMIGSQVVNDVAPKDRDVAMVFQNYALYPHMTVRENLAFGLKVRKVAPHEIERQIDDAAALLGLQPVLERKPKALSGGQRQRVALGRAIVRHPAVFLFDEPLSNLDADLRVQMRAELSKLQRRLGTTTVYVTHDQVEAMTLGHRISVLAPLQQNGRSNLQQTGTPAELYERPDNVFVARFIGTPAMNILEAVVGSDGRLTGAGFSVPPPPAFASALHAYAGQAILLGVRPEHVGRSGTVRYAHPAMVHGIVDIVECTGPDANVHVNIGGGVVLVARLEAREAPRLGDAVTLGVESDAIHLFDAQSGQRLTPAG